MKEDFFISKTACLLYDSPNKAWLLKDKKDYRTEANQVASAILMNTALEKATERMEEAARPAEQLASSFDKWLLREIVGENPNLLPASKIKLKNIFNPKFEIEVTSNSPSINGFVEDLNKAIKEIKDTRLAYHVLYACYEPEWMQLGLPVGPADARAPSQSIFDQNYSAAAASNWTLGKQKTSGILLYIDLGGPQRFISSSRKVSDLWASSYLASALAWRIFWIFVKALGPDVLVLPSCRGNPFYYHSLISELSGISNSNSAIERIKQISRKFSGYDIDRDKVPRYASIPVTATLMIPELGQIKMFDEFKEIEDTGNLQSLEQFVIKKYQEIWKSVYDSVTEKCSKLHDELGNLSSEAERLLNMCRQYGFDTVPPLPIRVVALHTNRLYELGLENRESYSMYHSMFKLMHYEISQRTSYKFRPEEDLKLTEMTSAPSDTWPIRSRRRYEYCTTCGYLPAMLVFPSDESEYANYLDPDLEPLFGVGERLCPYCFIKRLLRIPNVLKSVVDILLGRVSDELPEFRFPSVSDIALIPFKKTLIINAKKLDSNQELANEFCNWVVEIWGKIAEKGEPSEGREPITWVESHLAEEIMKLKNRELREDLHAILFLDAETSFLKTHLAEEGEGKESYAPMKDWLELRKKIYRHDKMVDYMNLKEERIEDINSYYAVIRCDGDNLGKILQGEVEDGFRIRTLEYICNMFEGPARDLIADIVNNKLEDARKKCEVYGLRDIQGIIDKISKLINELGNKKEIVISPSYHSALSRALVASAARDKETVDRHDGIVIYAGGDDLLALTPVKNSLSATVELRESFSFPLARCRGFYEKDGYLVPTLATASRSFCIYFAHYMSPLYSVVSDSAELLDGLAKESSWHSGTIAMKKDSLVISYSPRGGEEHALLPLSDINSMGQDIGKTLRYVDELTSKIEKGKFSSSLVYDLYNNIDTIIGLSSNETLLEALLKTIFARNCAIENKQQRKETAEKWAARLKENCNMIVKVNGNEQLFLAQFVLALKLYISGLKGAT